MIRRMVIGGLLLLMILPFSACDFRGLFLDEGNLEKVIAHHYRPGDTKNLDPEAMYKFLSAKSKDQVTRDEWTKRIKVFSDKYTYTSVKILGNREEKGEKYAVVSLVLDVKEKEGDTKKYVRSDTWMLESGKWRRLIFPKTKEETIKAFFDGDFAAAQAKAEEWLLLDPFSIEAFSRLGESMKNSHQLILKRGDRTIDDILRAILAINPEDTGALFCAATWAKDVSVAKSFLKKLDGTVDFGGAVSNVAIHIPDPEERLIFLSDMPEYHAEIKTVKLLTLYDLMRWDAFRAAYEKEGTFEILKAYFDRETTKLAANRAGELGAACFLSGNKNEAQRWLDYGISKDPNDHKVQKLATMMN